MMAQLMEGPLLVTLTGVGDWRLVSSPQTRVSVEQVCALSTLADVEDIGASEVRFGTEYGSLCVFHTDGRMTEVDEIGICEVRDV